MTVRTRFAPSPTGYMHIGGMRTAFFVWLWARHTGGQFILRIDDTDQQRNVDAALEPIFRAFRWLGLDWDEGPDIGGPYGPYYQSQRTHLYREAVNRMLADGQAYRDFETPDEIAEQRKQAEAAKRNYTSSRRSLEVDAATREQWHAEGKPNVVRLLVPRDRKVAVDDHVRGHVEWDCGQMPDPVLMRSDGSVLYNFATVVDDAHMQITHVIRAEEHLTNTAVQVLLHEALGHAPPEFAHIPFITAPGSTRKLSKRDLEKLRHSPQLKKLFDRADEIFPLIGLGDSTTLNPVMVEYYERLGYLPAGVLNALARLGWSLDDKTEILSLGEIVRHFTLDRVIKSPAALDPEKLQSYQAHWMNQLPIEQKIDGCLPFLERAGWPVSSREFLGELLTAIGDRLKVFSDILDHREFFIADDELVYDERAVQKRLRDAPEAPGLLRSLQSALATIEPFDAPTLEKLVHDFAERQGVKIGQIIHPLRLAVTGKSVGIGLFETLALLGRGPCWARMERLLEQLG
jgi:glutamyl-tRNA synthetase